MKRANGTGSIVKLSGNRRRPYAVKVSGRDRSGRVTQKIPSYHEKAADAQAALEAYQRARTAGTAPAGDTIICNENGKLINSNLYREYFGTVMEQIGIPDATPHWCRHPNVKPKTKNVYSSS